jgi:hypothetical protein
MRHQLSEKSSRLQQSTVELESPKCGFPSRHTAVAVSTSSAAEPPTVQAAPPPTVAWHDLSSVPVTNESRLQLQTKLMVNTPGDKYEQEADRVADAVMRMPKANATGTLSRNCAKCEEEDGGLLRKEVTSAVTNSRDAAMRMAPPAVHDTLNSPGQPLDAATRSFFEPRFGHDFSRVRVHTDGKAAKSAAQINAVAYTVGSNIVFSTGAFSPSDPASRKLIAHELVHVLQQDGQSNATPLRVESLNSTAKPRAESASEGPSTHRPTSATHPQRTVQRKANQPGLEVWKERSDADEEAQRKEAFNLISNFRGVIVGEATRRRIAPDAVAGAILWEAIENPYHLPFLRLGPGKVHESAAKEVERSGHHPTPVDDADRDRQLHDPTGAILYIVSIMRRDADNYLAIASVDIIKDVGVLCTLYQGGDSEGRARKLAARRKTDPKAMPVPADDMSRWVLANIDTISGWVTPPPKPH